MHSFAEIQTDDNY